MAMGYMIKPGGFGYIGGSVYMIITGHKRNMISVIKIVIQKLFGVYKVLICTGCTILLQNFILRDSLIQHIPFHCQTFRNAFLRSLPSAEHNNGIRIFAVIIYGAVKPTYKRFIQLFPANTASLKQ